ncbi:hypothetical protein FB45DRAFT_947131 [Roridomyces roridus]|uniref:F-box domain-containing protein n=1 Tax=Roridomyces roridus TaxID=1738132 RepID=A0AAD7FAU8_9AGAR|nr:hypothetical protein FB45DRAFT_947131 [Roridomyces roridus]
MEASICSKCGTPSSIESPNVAIQSLKNAAAPGTPMHSLIHSNEPPEPSEIPSIQSSASDIDISLASLDAEILRLQRLRSLQQDRSDLLDYQRTHKSILSPLRRMPAEILAGIFLSSLPTVTELLDRESFQTEDSPWVWTHICSRWRTVAISTPALWSLIAMDFVNYDYPLSAVTAHVERSRMLKIYFYASVDADDISSQTEMFRYLIQHSLRWEELHIVLTQNLMPLLPSLHHQMPSLRTLWVEWDSKEGEEAMRMVDFFRTADSLARIGVSRRFRPVSFLPPTQQLTHYYADASWDVHQEILRMSSSLVEAHIDLFPAPPEWTTLTGDAIELPHLRSYLKMPLLDQITLDLFLRQSDFLPALERFLADSSTTLRRLGLRGMPNALLSSRIFQACPELTELAMIFKTTDVHRTYETSNALFRLLIPTPGSAILSRLSRVHVAFEGMFSFDYDLFAQLLESRWNMQPRVLEAAALCFQGEPNHGSAHLDLRLKTLRTGGLDFIVSDVDNAQEYMAHWLCRPSWT